MRPALTLVSILLLSVFALGQEELRGPGQFPQFRNMSGLPGSGFGVRPDGRVSFSGALSYTTPIAYSLSHWEVVFGVSNVSTDRNLSIFKDNNSVLFDGNVGNGTWQLLVGIPLDEWGAMTFSYMSISSFMDDIQNLHWTPGKQQGRFRYGLGIQDIAGGGGASGEDQPGDTRESTSLYIVGTYDVGKGAFASFGVGETRFDPAFGNASFPLAKGVKAYGEYEAFNWNYGVAIDANRVLGRLRSGRNSHTTLMFGMAKGKYAFWSVSVAF